MGPCYYLPERMGMQGNDVLEGHDKVVVILALIPGFSCPFTPVGPETIRLNQFQQ